MEHLGKTLGAKKSFSCTTVDCIDTLLRTDDNSKPTVMLQRHATHKIKAPIFFIELNEQKMLVSHELYIKSPSQSLGLEPPANLCAMVFRVVSTDQSCLLKSFCKPRIVGSD